MTDPELDEMLRETMRSRPTPTVPFDLAARAVAMARAEAVRRVRRWVAAVNAIAGIIALGVVVAFVHARLAGGGFSAWSGEAAVTTSSSTTPWLLFAAAVVMGAIAVVAARSAWDAADGGIHRAA